MQLFVEKRRTYLWTFTLPTVSEGGYVDMRKSWNKCLTYLRRKLPAWAGMRVYEIHPGKWDMCSHGLHVHVVANKFHDIALVRAAAELAGFGRVHVCIRKGDMGFYLAKYLSKERPEALRGWRLWACFGMPGRIRLSDIIIDSLRARLFRVGIDSCAFDGLGWSQKLALVGWWTYQSVAGLRLTLPSMMWPHYRSAGTGGTPLYGAPRYAPRLMIRYENRNLTWGFCPRLPVVAPVRTANFSAWGGDDVLKSDLARDKAFRKLLALRGV